MGFMDILKMDLGKEFEKRADAYAEKRADEIEAENFEKSCLPVVTFDYCVQWAMEMKKEYPQSVRFLISVKENPDPRNENDNLCVIVAMLDENNKAITIDGEKGISTIFHGKTIDKKLIDSLNGKQLIIGKL